MSFRWMTMFRRGSWRAFRKFALEELRDVDSRIKEIDKSVDEIGKLTVTYKKEEGEKTTQIRTGFFVEKSTSLAKLLKAYIAMGGNPLDISMFLDPYDEDMEEIEDEMFIVRPPMGGVVSPLSGGPNEEVYIGGWYEWDKHYYWKIGKAEVPFDRIVWTNERVQASRDWIEKEIQNKRNKIEEKIIKLCDLREQLLLEKRHLQIRNYEFTEKREEDKLQSVERIIYSIDRILWKFGEDGINPDENKPRVYDLEDIQNATDEKITSDKDINKRGWHFNIFEDSESEQWPITAL